MSKCSQSMAPSPKENLTAYNVLIEEITYLSLAVCFHLRSHKIGQRH